MDWLQLPLEEQARRWSGRRQRSWTQAGQHATQARARLEGLSCTDYLMAHGFAIHFTADPHRLGPVRFRARVSLPERSVLVYEDALDEVGEALGQLGHGGGRAVARELVLAHETFHVLCPDCPEPVAELAAHRFATELLGLPFFAGLVDLVCAS